MKDKTIINTISNIYAVIFNTFFVIGAILSVIILFLQEGIYIDEISMPSVKIEKLYIKYHEKISLSIKNITINSQGRDTSSFDPIFITKLFSKFTWIKQIFGHIEINIHFNGINTSLKYNHKQSLTLKSSSKNFQLKSSIIFSKNFIELNIKKMQYLQRNISIYGKIICDNQLNLYSKIDLNINNEIILNLNVYLEKNRILYKIRSKKDISSIEYLIESLGLSNNLKYWVSDAIETSSIKIDKASGIIDLNNIKNSYKNINLEVTLNNLNYKYNKNLDSVHTKYTKIFFKNGSLIIKPHEAYSYNQFLGKSWVKIDFTKKTIPLSIYLLFNGVLNDDILRILKNYKIELPFIQKKGIVQTNLTIGIDLSDMSVNAYGNFYTKKANFDYIGLNLDLFDANITLNGYDVQIDNMYATYKDMVKSEVDLKFNAKSSSGYVDFRVDEIKLASLVSFNNKPLNVRYNIIPNQNSIDVETSRWLFKNETINIDKLKIPFDYETMILKIPTTRVTIDKIALLYASGERSLKTGITLLDIDLLRLSYKNLLLGQYKADLNFKHDKNFEITFKKKTLFKMNGADFNLQNTDILIDTKNIYLDSFATFDNIGSSNIHLNYNLSKKFGKFTLLNTDMKNIFKEKRKINFDFKIQKNNFLVQSKDIDFIFENRMKYWSLKLNNLSTIFKNSPLLQSVDIDNGNILIKKMEKENIKFNTSFYYNHKILFQNNESINLYNIYGDTDLKNRKTTLNINDLVDIQLNKNDLYIDMKNIGIDINEFLKILNNNSNNESSKKKNNNLHINMNAQKCYLYIGENRKILSDTIKMDYFNNLLKADLNYKNGKAVFQLYKNKFTLTGQNFNDNFMENIFALSKFRGGELNFFMNGSLQKYNGLLNIQNTTILDYKLLNNVLAFVNTIPSLLTFSLPGYNKKGLKVDNAYVNFHTDNDDINITDINLDSQEIDIKGRGAVNFKTNKIDIKLNLITDLASAISQVPVVGYILFGKDSISTSLKIDGALNAPVVTSLLAKELVVAPLNIIKRTILLPIHLFSSDDKNSSK